MAHNQQSNYSGAAVGFTVFAAVMMMMIGFFQAIAGIVALFNDEWYVAGVGEQDWTFKFDITGWGWIHLLLGIVIFLAGIALFSGQVWARTIGVILALASAAINFAWLPWYPVWGIIMIIINVFVVWALTAHGRDIAQP